MQKLLPVHQELGSITMPRKKLKSMVLYAILEGELGGIAPEIDGNAGQLL